MFLALSLLPTIVFFFFLLVLVFSIHALKITALLEIISDNKTKLRSASFYPLMELPKKNYNLRGLLKILCKTDFYFQSKSPFIYDLYSLLFLNKKLIYLIFKSKKSILWIQLFQNITAYIFSVFDIIVPKNSWLTKTKKQKKPSSNYGYFTHNIFNIGNC